MDSSLTMEKHVNNVSRICHYHLRNISRIKPYLNDNACKSLVQATVVSRLDYANGILYGITDQLMSKLQRVQNTAARIVTGTKRRDHITPVLFRLHWLPVHCRVQYKILLYAYKALNGTAPVYIEDLIKRHVPSRKLRSTDQCLLSSQRTRTKRHGNRSFKQVAPGLWNALPLAVKQASSINVYKKSVKTLLFKSYYNV